MQPSPAKEKTERNVFGLTDPIVRIQTDNKLYSILRTFRNIHLLCIAYCLYTFTFELSYIGHFFYKYCILK